MTTLSEIMVLLNPWWKTNQIEPVLAKQYRRKIYDSTAKLLDYRQIIIVSGLRRVGKTTLLYQLIQTMLHEPAKILYFNFDREVKDLVTVLETFQEQTKTDWKTEKICVFLDEITRLEGWATQIKLLYDAFPTLKFIVSSSSSVGLEKEAIVNLAGRYFMINMKPLSFIEYLELKQKDVYLKNILLWEKELNEEAKKYILRSFPETINWPEEALIKDYLKTAILDKILREDLPQKYKNINPDLLLTLLQNFYHDPGMYLDYDSLASKLRISKKTLIQHIFYLEFSYLLRRVKNMRPSAMATSRKMQRVYPYWWNLAYIYGDNFDKIMENIVVSLVDSNYYWRKDGKEIDALKIEGKIFIPIEVKNKEDLDKHDIQNLKYFLQKYKVPMGVIVFQGKDKQIKTNNQAVIHCIPLWKWLLNHPNSTSNLFSTTG